MTVADEEDDHTDEPALISTSSGVPLWKLIKKGALISRIGFWGILYYNYNQEPPKK